MVVFGTTIIPIIAVLRNGGSMRLEELTELLNSPSYGRFGEMEHIIKIIDSYIGCLKIVEGDRVMFNREAKSYSKNCVLEREIDIQLHDKVPGMKNFELYPHKTPQNSPTCPIGVKWGELPAVERNRLSSGYSYRCDYRVRRHEGCTLFCGLKVSKAKKLGIDVRTD
jgi:hypothetical protein